MLQLYGLLVQGFLRAHLGDADGARASADSAQETASDLMEFFAAPWFATRRHGVSGRGRRSRRPGGVRRRPADRLTSIA